MRKKLFVSCFLALALSAAPSLALAFGPGGHGGHGDSLMAYKLLFNDEQNKQLDETLKASRTEMKPLIEKLMEERKAMHALMQSDTSTEKDIRAEAAKIGEIMADMAVKKAAQTKAIRKIATKDQLAKIDAFREKQHAKREHFHEAMRKMMEQDAK
ncbi:MAG: periplasmic heavy metal sensor [Desulfovibrionaceae bacterium]|nr:periplasmic heavy metal sensor [Desulfovibrionaceae bacterium]MBF0514247.1 periplasmic heavy metal sensor [Desulfovibrionaceae bacterium]